MLLTNLGSAFETIDHQLVLNKLAHIGVRERSGELMKSFLTDRGVYTQIQGYNRNLNSLGDKISSAGFMAGKLAV